MIQEQIVKLKAIVNQNSMGHLPLPHRVDLMKQIGSTHVVQKILCECCKKVYPLWEKMFDAETPLYKVLSDADDYLYKDKGSAKDLLASVEKWRNYAEQSSDEAEAMAGWAIIALGYAIRYNAASILNIEDYCGEDDNAFDHEGWNVDFICSIAYSGSNPFIRNTGNAEKRREYWRWYLDMVLAICKNPDMPYTKIKPAPKKPQIQVVIPKRSQSWQTENVSNQLQQLIHTLTEETNRQMTEWDKIVFNYTLTLASYASIVCYREEEVLPISLNRSVTDFVYDTLFDIHKDMYQQAPKEGAWMQCCITIYKGNSYDISFNYDDVASIPDTLNDPDWLVGTFEDYPRSKEYTPQWYRDIIGKRKVYLS